MVGNTQKCGLKFSVFIENLWMYKVQNAEIQPLAHTLAPWGSPKVLLRSSLDCVRRLCNQTLLFPSDFCCRSGAESPIPEADDCKLSELLNAIEPNTGFCSSPFTSGTGLCGIFVPSSPAPQGSEHKLSDGAKGRLKRLVLRWWKCNAKGRLRAQLVW